MRKAVLALAATAAMVGCNRQSTYEPPRSSAPAAERSDDTWVAQPSELSTDQVRTVQQALTNKGFQVEASGTFDAATQTALAEFQRSRGLPATGNVNADTAAALGVRPDEVRPARDPATAGARERPATEVEGRPGEASGDRSTAPSSTSGTPPDAR